jgi:hypothetical protein
MSFFAPIFREVKVVRNNFSKYRTYKLWQLFFQVKDHNVKNYCLVYTDVN